MVCHIQRTKLESHHLSQTFLNKFVYTTSPLAFCPLPFQEKSLSDPKHVFYLNLIVRLISKQITPPSSHHQTKQTILCYVHIIHWHRSELESFSFKQYIIIIKYSGHATPISSLSTHCLQTQTLTLTLTYTDT